MCCIASLVLSRLLFCVLCSEWRRSASSPIPPRCCSIPLFLLGFLFLSLPFYDIRCYFPFPLICHTVLSSLTACHSVVCRLFLNSTAGLPYWLPPTRQACFKLWSDRPQGVCCFALMLKLAVFNRSIRILVRRSVPGMMGLIAILTGRAIRQHRSCPVHAQ